MPFKRYEPPANDKIIPHELKRQPKSLTVDHEELPIFLIPGILGNGNELRELALALYRERGGRTPIYIYEEPTDNNERLLEMNMLAHSTTLSNEILEETHRSPTPKIIVGFSSGALINFEICSELEKQGFSTIPFMLDQPTRAMVTARAGSKSHTKDFAIFKQQLIDTANYAARLSGLRSVADMGLSIDADEIDSLLRSNRIISFFNSLIQQAQKSQADDQNELKIKLFNKFIHYMKVAKRNLTNFVSKEPERDLLSHIYYLMLNQTAINYGATQESAPQFTAGWEKYAEEITSLDVSVTLKAQSHMALLDKANAPVVAKLISDSLKKHPSLTDENLLALQVRALSQQFSSRKGCTEATAQEVVANSFGFFKPFTTNSFTSGNESLATSPAQADEGSVVSVIPLPNMGNRK